MRSVYYAYYRTRGSIRSRVFAGGVWTPGFLTLEALRWLCPFVAGFRGRSGEVRQYSRQRGSSPPTGFLKPRVTQGTQCNTTMEI